MSEREGIQTLIAKHTRRLQILKEQQAQYGLSTPPEIIMEIEDIEPKIEALKRKLLNLIGLDFIDRKEIIAEIVTELTDGATRSLVLYGQRRIGKTKLLGKLVDELPQNSFLAIYFDLKNKDNLPLGQLLRDLAGEIVKKSGLNISLPDDFDDQGEVFRTNFLSRLWEQIDQKRLILLFDEFETLSQIKEVSLLEAAAVETLFPFLQKLIAKDTRLFIVVAVGKRAEDLNLDIIKRFSSTKKIERFGRESAEVLIRQTEIVEHPHFTNEAIQYILSLTGGHPSLTERLGREIWWANRQSSEIGESEVETFVNKALKDHGIDIAWLWAGLTPAQKLYTAVIAGELADQSESLSEAQIKEAIENLKAGYGSWRMVMDQTLFLLTDWGVLKEVRESRYKFSIELFRWWVRQYKPSDRVIEDLQRLKEDRFKQAETFFSQWEWAAAIQYYRRVLRLDPDHFESRLYLGQALFKLNRIEEAVEELELAYKDGEVAAYFSLATALDALIQERKKKGNDEGALEASERALAVSPGEQALKRERDEILERLFTSRLKAGCFQDARFYARNNAQRIEQVKQKMVKEAQAFEDNQPSEAVDLYAKLIEWFGTEDNRGGRWRIALNKLLVSKENKEESLFDAGIKALERQAWAEAQEAFDEVFDLNPDYRQTGQSVQDLRWRARRKLRRFELVGQAGDVHRLAFLSATEIVVVAGEDNVVNIWRLTEEPTRLYQLEKHPTVINCLTFSPTGEILAAGDRDKKVVLWRVKDGRRLQTLAEHRGPVTSIAFSPEQGILASGTGRHTVHLWRTDEGKSRTLEGHNQAVDSLVFSPDGRLLASGARDHTVRLWFVENGTPRHTLHKHKDWVSALAFSPAGAILASGGWDRTINLWQAAEGALLHSLSGHTKQVNSVAFSPTGEILASGSADKSVRLWRVSDGQPLEKKLDGLSGPVNDITFSPDGTVLAFACKNSIYLWYGPTD